jgi:hypothetical protein
MAVCYEVAFSGLTRLGIARVQPRSNLMGGTVQRRTRDCRSSATPDSDPGAGLSRASRDPVRGNDHGLDAHAS